MIPARKERAFQFMLLLFIPQPAKYLSNVEIDVFGWRYSMIQLLML